MPASSGARRTTAPPSPSPSPWWILDYWVIVLAKVWRAMLISAIFVPTLYLLAMGVVLGRLVDAGPARLDGADSYLAFVGPGLLASHIMIAVLGEATWPVMGMVKWSRSYVAMIATPLRVRDVVVAHLGAITAKVVLVSTVFTLVLLVGGVVEQWWRALMLVPVQVLLGLAFAGVVHALTVTMLSDAFMNVLWRVVAMPLFLFSGAFFPITNLPRPLEALAHVTPLWHGVDLSRIVATGQGDLAMVLVHVVYLAVMAAVGGWWAVRALERRLLR